MQETFLVPQRKDDKELSKNTRCGDRDPNLESTDPQNAKKETVSKRSGVLENRTPQRVWGGLILREDY